MMVGCLNMRGMIKISRKLIAALLLAGVVVLIGGISIVQAHEDRDVAGGKYQFRVGFINEPTYQGLENGIELTVCMATCVTNKDGSGTFTNGITGLFDTLKAEVIFGEQKLSLPLVAVPRNPGRYHADFVPTRTGDYTFHFSGTIGPDKIDEKFTSGPSTFDSVLPLTTIQFPDKPGYASNSILAVATAIAAFASPSANGGGVATSTVVAVATPAPTSVANSNTNDIQQLKNQLQDQKQQLENAKNSAASANAFAIGGIIAGVLGILIGGAALFFSRRGKGAEPEAG